MQGGMNMGKLKIKDPGSAITHFIAMLMAVFAAVPLYTEHWKNQIIFM